MYSLISYTLKNNRYFQKDRERLFRGVRLPYTNILQFKQAKRKVILMKQFTLIVEEKKIV